MLYEQNILKVEYESMLHDEAAVMDQIMEYLDVELIPLARNKSARSYKKSTPDRLCEAVSNYNEFCNHFAHTEYSTYFMAEDPCDSHCI